MDDHSFDGLSKVLATSVSRRQSIKTLGAFAAGALLSLGGVRDTAAKSSCSLAGKKCRQNSDCCSNYCNPANATCECEALYHFFACPKTGLCVSCNQGQVLNPNTCACECPTDAVACNGAPSYGSICCSTGSTCCQSYFGQPTCCPSGTTCDPYNYSNNFCSYV